MVKHNLNYQKSLVNDQYPGTIVEINNVLSNHKFDMSNNKKQEQKHTKENKNKDNKEY